MLDARRTIKRQELLRKDNNDNNSYKNIIAKVLLIIIMMAIAIFSNAQSYMVEEISCNGSEPISVSGNIDINDGKILLSIESKKLSFEILESVDIKEVVGFETNGVLCGNKILGASVVIVNESKSTGQIIISFIFGEDHIVNILCSRYTIA